MMRAAAMVACVSLVGCSHPPPRLDPAACESSKADAEQAIAARDTDKARAAAGRAATACGDYVPGLMKRIDAIDHERAEVVASAEAEQAKRDREQARRDHGNDPDVRLAHATTARTRSVS
jgi:hypothetical protein